MNLLNCAPDRQYKNRNTCFSHKSLIKIANSYNEKTNSSDQIEIKDNIDILHSNIQKKLNKVCNGDICWLKQDFVRELNDNEINSFTFKPIRPDGKYQWLSTVDIRKVMLQYEKKFPGFSFIGPVPIDFDDIHTEISKMDFNKMKKNNIDKVGIVFNLDEHYKSGSHWVGLYMEFSDKRKEVNYFDSYGEDPDDRIKVLMNRLVDNASNDLGITLRKNINIVRTQFANSECGVYSMNFILHLLMGDSFKKTTENIVRDEHMNNRRNLFFRKK